MKLSHLLSGFLLAAWPSVPTAQEVTQSFTLITSALESVVGGRAKLESPGTRLVLPTNSGRTASFRVDLGATYDLHLKQAPQPQGTALGQSIAGWTPTAPAGFDPRFDRSPLTEDIFTQPILRPTRFDSGEPVVQHADDPLWRFGVEETDSGPALELDFTVQAGSLPTGRCIERTLRYAGVEPLYEDYRWGLAFLSDSIESFGAGGSGLQIRCAELGFEQAPDVDVYFLGHEENFGETTLQVLTKGWIEGGDLLLELEGAVGRGLTLVLLRPASDGDWASVEEFVARPPRFGPRDRRFDPRPAEVRASTCEVTYDPTDFEAGLEGPAPPAPSSTGFCAHPPSQVSSSLTREVHQVPAEVVCGGGGGATSSVSQTVTTTWSGDFSVGFSTAGGLQVAGGGSYSRSETHRYTIGPGEGEGCGQCIKGFKRRTKVSTLWKQDWPSFSFWYPHRFQGCKDRLVTNHKLHAGYDLPSCDRPCEEEGDR